MIKVLLADDHQLFIDGLRAILQKEKNIQIVGEANNGDEVLNELEIQSVDVVVLDIEMPNTDGIEATKLIRKEYPKVKVLILSMHNRKNFIIELMRAGAAGYILKDRSRQELVQAIHNVHNGKSHYGLDVLNQVTDLDNKNQNENVKLSAREKEVVCLIGEGKTTKDISKELHISEATVNTHRRNLLQKLEVPNDKHLVRYAIKYKLIEL